jgi:Ion channel
MTDENFHILHFLFAWCLMAVCVASHAIGVTMALHKLRRVHGVTHGLWPWTWLLIRLAGWMIFIHLLEISVWGLFYAWQGAMPDLQSALYFSGVTYTTTGYGDLLLPSAWRLVGAVEALTGILMCGLSTGFFFAVANRVVEAKSHR